MQLMCCLCVHISILLFSTQSLSKVEQCVCNRQTLRA